MKFLKFFKLFKDIADYWKSSELPFRIKLADLWSYLFPRFSRRGGTTLYSIHKD